LNTPVLLFLLNPFIGVIQAFKHYRESWAKNSIWLFVIFFGFTMFRPEAMDSNRYVQRLEALYDAPLSWETFIANFYSAESNTVDIYQPLITYFLSLFTKNANVLFAVFGIVYGYFYSRNIWLLLDASKGKPLNRPLWILIFGFASVIGYWELNGVRMWTAAHMFFYGAYLFLIQGKRNGYLIALASILVHFSFVLPVAILTAYTIVKVPWKILYYVFLASFFVSELNIASVSERLKSIAPEFLVPRIDSYTNDQYLETIAEAVQTNWYVTFYLKALGWFIFIMITYVYFFGLTKIKSNKAFSNFFGFTILFLTVGNLMSLIPSGGRYLTIARIFALALLFLFYIWYGTTMYRRYLTTLSPLLVFFIIVSLRVSFDTTTFMTLFGNPIIAVLVDFPVPLINLLK
jgi:hypothetical protein